MTRRNAVGRGVTLSLGLAGLGCSGKPAPDAFAVRDSSGVRVVDLPSPSTTSPVFALSETPVYRVGWGDEDRQFERVVAGALRLDGSAVVGDAGGTLEVVFLSQTGSVEAIVGGPGDGPGELRSIFALLAFAGDTVAVQDPENARITMFAPAGELGTVPLKLRGSPRLLGIGDQGDLLLGPPLYVVVGRRYETSWLGVPLVALSTSSGEADTLASADWDQSISEGGGRSPFMSGGFATVADGAFVVGRGDRPELRWLNHRGAVRQIARWHEPPRAVSSADVDAWEVEMRAAYDRVGTIPQADIDEAISTMKEAIGGTAPFFGPAGGMPGYGGLLSDPLGNVWIAAYRVPRVRSPGRYFVVSPRGAWLGWVDIPAGLRVLAIGTDRVLGVEEDELDRQAVVMYELTQAGSE